MGFQIFRDEYISTDGRFPTNEEIEVFLILNGWKRIPFVNNHVLDYGWTREDLSMIFRKLSAAYQYICIEEKL